MWYVTSGPFSFHIWTHVVTFNVRLIHDLDLGFSRLNFWIAVYRNARAHRHQTKGIWVDRVLYLLCGLQLWPWPWIFKVKFWKCCAHLHGTKGMWVDRMLDSHCDLKLFPHPWPLPWIFKGQILKLLYLGNGKTNRHGTKGMWVDRMLCDLEVWPWTWILIAQWDWPWATVRG